MPDDLDRLPCLQAADLCPDLDASRAAGTSQSVQAAEIADREALRVTVEKVGIGRGLGQRFLTVLNEP